jgi:hypothetical protein
MKYSKITKKLNSVGYKGRSNWFFHSASDTDLTHVWISRSKNDTLIVKLEEAEKVANVT